MSAAIDFEGIARSALAHARQLLEAWLPAGKWAGREYLVGNIDGDPGESLSINSVTGAWADFGGDARGGDLVSLYAAIKRMSQADAARAVAAILGQPIEPRKGVVVPLKPRDEASREWSAIIPVPDNSPAPPTTHFRHGTPKHVARYLDQNGALLGLIYRFELSDDKKQFSQLTYCRNAAGATDWRWQSLPIPRSLYGAELLSRPGRVLVVEGEKTAEAARRLLGDALIVVSWPGGAKAVAHADWSLLAGREVIVWPDADPAGHEAAAQILIRLRHSGASARTVDLPRDLPPKWDLADAEKAGWSFDRVMSWVDPQLQDEEPPPFEPEPEASYRDFVPLGHDRGRFYFFTSGGGQVRDFSARDLQSVGHLCELAPLRYWEMNHPGKGDAGFNIRSAGDTLVREAYGKGIYDPERLRGRGAWLDEGRTVLHLGNRLIVDGAETGLADIESSFIYEQGRRLNLTIGDPNLSSKHAAMLMDLCMAAPWEDQAGMGRLLAGWLVIAPVCGAMPWRPHIWVTGEAGSGKTWVVDNLIRPIVGDIGLPVASKTSEAGVRGDLGLDARPVIFDEFESQNDHDRARVQQVLDLARQASSEDGAAIVKGTQTGGSRRYRIRSCFAFCSINLGLQQAADESRTVVLTAALDPDPEVRREAYRRLLAKHAEVVTPTFRADLLARTISLLPIIRANAEVFASAIARLGNTRRTGDTIGVLLAGAWSLRSRSLATPAEAEEFLRGTSWVRNAVGRSEADPEWRRALDFMIQVPLRTATSNRAPQDIPVGELITSIMGTSDESATSLQEAMSVVTRAGLRIVYEGNEAFVLIATGSETLRKAFSSTSWASSWTATLARAPQAEKINKTVRFASFTSKVLKINVKTVLRPAEL